MASTASNFNAMRSGYAGSDAIYISKDEYERLIQISRHYASLRENLIRGGVTDETVDLLSDIVATNQNQHAAIRNESPEPGYERDVAKHPHPVLPNRYTHSSALLQNYARPQWMETNKPFKNESPDTDTPSHLGGGHENESENDRSEKPNTRRFARVADRTILLSSLPEGTTHADITAVVRGGLLLDIFIRYKERAATVSFAYEEDAYAFFEHVRKYDLYIKQKRVEVSWSERQFTLSNHIGHKINIGATRNLVIRRCGREHTEESIREDLEHIHNLIVVNIDFIGNNCFISTNSVACATFARTCMMSRLKYKGSRVEFDHDECAQPLVVPRQKRAPAAPFVETAASVPNSMANRFHLLDIDV